MKKVNKIKILAIALLCTLAGVITINTSQNSTSTILANEASQTSVQTKAILQHNYISGITDAYADANFYYAVHSAGTSSYSKSTNELVVQNTATAPAYTSQLEIRLQHGVYYVYENATNKKITTDPYVISPISAEKVGSYYVILTEDGIEVIDASGNKLPQNGYAKTIPTNIEAKEANIYKPASMSVYGSQIIITDASKNSIMVFALNSGKIEFVSQPIASIGTDNGRLINPTSVHAINEHTYIVSDISNRITITNTEEKTSSYFGTSGTKNGQFDQITSVTYDGISLIYVADSQNRVQSFTLDGNFVASYSNNYKNINSLEADSNGTIYFLDGTDAKIYYKTINMPSFQLLANLDSANINLNGTSKIAISSNNKELYVSNSVFSDISAQQNASTAQQDVLSTILVQSVNHSSAAIDIATDHLNRVYILADSSIHCTTTNTTHPHLLTETLTSFHIDKLSGKVLIASSQHTVKTLKDLAQNEITYNKFDTTAYPKEEYKTKTNLTTAAQIYKVKYNTSLFQYPYNLEKLINIPVDSKIIVLDTINEYSQILYGNLNGYILTEYLQTYELNLDPFEQGDNNGRIIYNNTKIYKFPSPIVILDDVKNIDETDKIEVVGLCDITDFNGYTYYEIKYDGGKIGYVNSKSLIYYYLPPSDVTLQTNAKVNIFDEQNKITVYDYKGDPIFEEYLTDKHTIYVADFDIESDYTFIKYVDQFNIERSGYILTKYVALDTTDNITLVALIVSGICAMLAVVLVVNHKAHTKKMKLAAQKAKNTNTEIYN